MNEKIRLTALEKSRLPDEDARNVIRFCPNCGREIPPDRQKCVFCENTGAISRPLRPRRRKYLTIILIVIILFVLLLIALYLTRK
ncbi:MAG: hypothetical protein IJI41_05235 [Anaerolineaceae bacterium]|nr:hypothetical protein [Anaerolineaceae bacterium]